MRSILLTALFLALALAAPALASDGVAEINQTCAVSTGCFPEARGATDLAAAGGQAASQGDTNPASTTVVSTST